MMNHIRYVAFVFLLLCSLASCASTKKSACFPGLNNSIVQRMEANNKITNLNNKAIIFNGLSSKGFRKNNYGYGYGHNYNHYSSSEHSYALRQKLAH